VASIIISKINCMKKIIIALLIISAMYACGNQNGSPAAKPAEEKTASENPSYDPHRGEGKFKDVEVSGKLDAAMAEEGNKVYSVKCGACHKTTDEKLVGQAQLEICLVRMPNQNLSDADARSLYEFMRKNDGVK
jgi:hypothetical protein